MEKKKENFLSISEAAVYLGISEATLRRWDHEGTFKATFVSPGKHRYYSVADLQKKTKGIFQVAMDWVSAEQPSEPEHDFYCASSDRFKTRYETMTHLLDTDPSLQSTASLISSAAGEIGNNSFDHNLGNWPDVRGIFFTYDLGKRMIVLADRGVGVLHTLSRVRPELKIDEEALRVAFTEFVTGRFPEHRGNGLKYVKDALTRVGAELRFYSGEAVLELRKPESEFRISKTELPIRGSLAMIKY